METPKAGLPIATLLCLVNACLYVGLLYIWRGRLPRDHPRTIKRRLLSTSLACCVVWLPAFWIARVHQSPTPVAQLLGLRLPGLARAIIDSLYLSVTLFAGPIVYFIYTAQPPPPRSQPLAARAGATGQSDSPSQASYEPESASPVDAPEATGGSAAHALRLHSLQKRTGVSGTDPSCDPYGRDEGVTAAVPGSGRGGRGPNATAAQDSAASRLAAWLRDLAGDWVVWRNLVAAPVTEEFVFRACMVPLLKLQGMSNSRVMLLTPLFFGAAHVHHAVDLVRHQHVPLRRALLMVAFQFGYTTVFGWLATYLFLRTGHLAAPVMAHVFCNWAGFPPFGDMAAHPRGVLLMLTTVAGVATFFMVLPRLTAPERYAQDFYV